MKCKSCGAQLDSGDRFCRECGMPVGGGKRADNKEEGYADNIFSKSGRFDAVYFVPMAILLGVLFIISFAGIYIGHYFGSKYEKKAELAGGIILICIGLKILFEHLGIF